METKPMKRGQTKPYLLARLEYDHPEVFARLKAGEIKTVHAAAREAGIIRWSFQVQGDPVKAAKSIFYRFFYHSHGHKWLSDFLSELDRRRKQHHFQIQAEQELDDDQEDDES
jgi:hypothetical protein